MIQKGAFWHRDLTLTLTLEQLLIQMNPLLILFVTITVKLKTRVPLWTLDGMVLNYLTMYEKLS